MADMDPIMEIARARMGCLLSKMPARRMGLNIKADQPGQSATQVVSVFILGKIWEHMEKPVPSSPTTLT
jgi:hypothetical protein